MKGRPLRVRRAVAPLLAAALSVGLATAVAAEPTTGVFGSIEHERVDMTAFPRWAAVLRDSAQARRPAVAADCGAARSAACQSDPWAAIIGTARGLEPMAQLQRIDAVLDQQDYVSDSTNWGRSDHWATPAQFLARGGDCEDFAIAKYMALRALGWPASALRVVIVSDLNLGIRHAVLEARHAGRRYILDNQIDRPVTDDRISHYRPIYSLGEGRWWRHITPDPARPRSRPPMRQ
ncbi:transglutaminase-like cysteine peptidase [Roseospira goensis]|uniref:Putative transglutaminase-like cysteine proteinase n=1 Tax=Roseospira goensis TaxID=391922 RepID=A0A7W6RYI5_9PROT|nr:transglutaminase-like cysteine peptidase [Roseospira goensis]MBB4284934.1 putative transglutaminase-like cysteine proteinase [Roseospira goensis]